jgi:hypothetical protein
MLPETSTAAVQGNGQGAPATLWGRIKRWGRRRKAWWEDAKALATEINASTSANKVSKLYALVVALFRRWKGREDHRAVDPVSTDQASRTDWLERSLQALEAAVRAPEGARPAVRWIGQDPDLAALRASSGWTQIKSRLEEEAGATSG